MKEYKILVLFFLISSIFVCNEKSFIQHEFEIIECSADGVQINIFCSCLYYAKNDSEDIREKIKSLIDNVLHTRISEIQIKDLIEKREIYVFNTQDVKNLNYGFTEPGIIIQRILIKDVIFPEQIQDVLDLKNTILNEKQKLESLLISIADLPEEIKKKYDNDIENQEILIRELESHISAIDKWNIYEK
jgi:hypothetical protein